jgi:hypothetical protein
MLVIDTRLRTGGTCVVAMDVAAMGMAIVPIVEFLDWGWRVWGRIAATTTIEEHAAALVTPTTIAIASVESYLPTAIVVAATTTATAGLSLLDSVLSSAALAALCSTTPFGLLWVLKHACRGLGAKCIAEHLYLPLHGIDRGIVVV